MKLAARLGSLAGVAAALVAPAGGCFYMNEINERPSATVEFVDPLQLLTQDQIVYLTAYQSTDPNGDRLTYHWKALRCRQLDPDVCETDYFASLSTDTTSEFSFPIVNANPVRVTLVVEDSYGAEAGQPFVVVPQNSLPTANLFAQGHDNQGSGGFTLSRQVEVIATADDIDLGHADQLTFAYQLFPAPGSVPADVVWETKDDRHHLLIADVPGLWRVEVTVTDPEGAEFTDEVTILIEDDEPPCILSTDPLAVPDAPYILDRTGAPRRFAVLSIRDDLDPYPLDVLEDEELGIASFRWWIATPATAGEWVEVIGHEVADYTVDPAVWAPGDRLDVRVDALDRTERELPCDPAQATCSLAGDGCLQRLTWSVEVR